MSFPTRSTLSRVLRTSTGILLETPATVEVITGDSIRLRGDSDIGAAVTDPSALPRARPRGAAGMA